MDDKFYIKISVNKKELSIDKDEIHKITAGHILEMAGYDKKDYDLFTDCKGAKKIDPDELVQVEDNMRFNAIRRSNPYGNDS